MSSSSFRRPDFRLSFDYPIITLTESGQAEPLAEVDLSGNDLAQRMRALSGRVTRSRGRLTVVLPEEEVWRGKVALAAQSPRARRAEARSVAAAQMGLAPAEISAELGEPDAEGHYPIAVARHSTLAETRGFLRQSGLRPARIIGAGSFPGFTSAPRLDAPIWRDVTRQRLPRAIAPTRGASAATALAFSAACIGLVFALTPHPAEIPAGAPEIAPIAELTLIEPLAPPLEIAGLRPIVPTPAPAIIAPRPRPADLATARAPTRLAEIAPARPMITQASRNMPELAGIRPGDDLSAGRVAERILPKGTLTDSAAPLSRPTTSAAPVPGIVATPALATNTRGDTRPLRRPGTATVQAPAALVSAAPVSLASAAAAQQRPAPRPGSFASAPLSSAITDAVNRADATPARSEVRVASLSTATDAGALVAVAAASGIAAAPPPEPRPARKAAPVKAAAPAQPKVAKAAPAQPVRVQPAVQKQVVAETRPTTAQPVRVAAVQPATQQSGLSRGNVSLLGVFAGKDGRHALLRLPNGSVKRVRQGDSIQGTQVSAVSADSVRLSGSGRDVVLRMEN